MGFVDHPSRLAQQHLTATDYIRLAILGAATRAPLAAGDAIPLVEALAGPLWSPSGQLINDTLDLMIELGHLDHDGRSGRLGVTGPGRRQLTSLLSQPVAMPPGSFGQIGIRLKMAFLDLLPPILRRHQLGAIIRAYECEVARRGTRCRAWMVNGPQGRAWLDHDLDMLEEELALLRRMARDTEPLLFPGRPDDAAAGNAEPAVTPWAG